MRGPVGTFKNVDIEKNAEQLIAGCVRELVLVSKSEDEVRAFFDQRFGW